MVPEVLCDGCGKQEGDESLLRCSNCRSVYYCDRECQKTHWKAHKGYCLELSEAMKNNNFDLHSDYISNMKDFDNDQLNFELSEHQKRGTANSFCFRCFNYFTDNIPLEPATVHLARAAKAMTLYLDLIDKKDKYNDYSKSSIDLQIEKYYSKASEEIDIFLQAVPGYPGGFYMKSELLFISGKYAEAIDNISQLPAETLPAHAQMQINMQLAKCHMELRNYVQAMKSFAKAFPHMEPGETERVVAIVGCARCLFELDSYDKAIDTAIGAITINRHCKDGYKYIYLSYEKLGRLDECVKWTKYALKYETPWDEKNLSSIQAKLAYYKSLCSSD